MAYRNQGVFATYKSTMNDEELLLFFLLLLQLLQQNRQLRFRRLFAFTFMLQWQRLLHLQRTAIQHFISLYRSRRAWVYHRRNNEFDEYYNADVHGHLELDPDYWRSNFRMSRDSFQFLCNSVHDFLVKEESHLRETIPVPKRVAVRLSGGCQMVVLIAQSGKLLASSRQLLVA